MSSNTEAAKAHIAAAGAYKLKQDDADDLSVAAWVASESLGHEIPEEGRSGDPVALHLKWAIHHINDARKEKN